MPEAPDVIVFKQYLDATSLHKTVERAEVRDRRMVKDVQPETLRRHLSGTRLESTHRHGKWLFVRTRDGPSIGLHFGMTGGLRYGKDPEERHARMRLDFADGTSLCVTSQRRLGAIAVVHDEPSFIEEKRLGPDVERVGRERFVEVLQEKGGRVKSALMDQSTFAGLGNEYTDEALFDAGVHPETRLEKLDGRDLSSLYDSVQKVIGYAVEARVERERFPRSALLPRRFEGARCPRDDARLAKDYVGGRPTFHCPKHQEKR